MAFDYDDILEQSSLILYGDVVSTSSCYVALDGTAWTFITISVIDTLAGTPLKPDGSALGSSTFTFRLPGGDLPESQILYHGGTPMLFEDDRVVVFLTYDENDEPIVNPLAFDGRSVYRVVPRPGGATSVISGDGFPIFASYGDFPRTRGRVVGASSAQYGTAAPDSAALGTAADALEDPVPSGGVPWRGVVRVVATESGAGGRTAICEAPIDGEKVGNSLGAYGRCNLDYVGAVDVVLDAVRSGTQWSGTISGESVRWPDEVADLTLSGQSRSTADVLYFSAEGGEQLVGGVPSLISGTGLDFDWEMTGWAVNVGPTPLLTDVQFRTWAQARAAANFPGSGRPIRSMSGTECVVGPVRTSGGGAQ